MANFLLLSPKLRVFAHYKDIFVALQAKWTEPGLGPSGLGSF